MKSRILIAIALVMFVVSLYGCGSDGGMFGSVGQLNSPVRIEPFLIDGTNTWTYGKAAGVSSGKYLKFKLTNTSSEDYLVQFTLTTKGKIQDSEGIREHVFQIPNIIAPAYAKTENIFSCMAYSRKGYWTTTKTQFFGVNSDGSCLAESVSISDVKIVKASEHPERIKVYRREDGKLVYDTQGAFADGWDYSQKIIE